MHKVNVVRSFDQVDGYWNPLIAGSLNGQDVKLVKCKGHFVWHHHEAEDELFYVVKGRFVMEFRDRIVTLQEGEFIIVQKGVEHRPFAEEEVWIMLFEPSTTLNTGNVEHELTKYNLQKL